MVVSMALAWHWHLLVFLVACCGVSVRVCVAVGGLVQGQRLLLLFEACTVTCDRCFTVLRLGSAFDAV